MKALNILIDIGHPAHVHLFKNLIHHLKGKNHHVVVVSRDKDVTLNLLRYYKIESIVLSKVGTNPLKMLGELTLRDLKVFKLHRKHGFDIALGTSYSIAHLSALSRMKSFVFEEDDDHIVPLFSALTYPFATGVVIPACLKYKKWSKKRILHNSYHELAYLHPDVFTPDKKIPQKYGLHPFSYILARFSALKAHHDINKKGLTGNTWERILHVLKDFPVVSTREGELTNKIAPWDMHHILAFSKMLLSDSQSMTMEAANLGVPSLRYSSFAGRISCLEELEHRYRLTFGFKPGEEDHMIQKIKNLLKHENLEEKWQDRRKTMLQEKDNFFKWQVKFFNSLLR